MATKLIPGYDFQETQHQRPEPPAEILRLFGRLDQLKREKAIAAAEGDVSRWQSLDTEEGQIEARVRFIGESNLAEIQEAQNRRDAGKPSAGEVGRLGKKRRDLEARIAKADRKKAQLLKSGNGAGAERVDEQQQEDREELARTEARLEQIRGWTEQQQRERSRLASEARHKRWEIQRSRREKALEKIAGEAVQEMREAAGFFFDGEVAEKVEIQTGDSVVITLTFQGKRRKHAD